MSPLLAVLAEQGGERRPLTGGKGLAADPCCPRPRHASRGLQALPAAARQRDERGDGTTTIGDLEAVACGHPRQPATRMLAELANADRLHVLQGSTWLAFVGRAVDD